MLEIKEVEGARTLRGVTLTVDQKGIYGILGSKGAGKTELARILTGCENAESGDVLIGSEKMSRKNKAAKKRIRLVPTSLELHGTVTPVEYLDLVGDSLGVDPDKRYRQIKEALELVGIDDVQNKPFSALGASARCRLALAASLLGNPEYIVLDDPFSMIDGEAQSQIYELLDMLAKIKTLILLSHKAGEVKRLCERVAILHGGKVALSGSIADIEEKINGTAQTYAKVRGEGDRIVEAIRGIDGVVDTKITATESGSVNSVSIEHLPDDMIKDKLFSALAAIGSPMLSVKSVVLTLEDVFYSFSASESDKDESDTSDTSGKRKNKQKRQRREEK